MKTSADNPLLHLATLAAIANQGSFTKAADGLGLNRAAISKRIAQMEMALGVPVLARTTRKVELTPAGKALLARHHEAEAVLQMAVDEARGTMHALGGKVRVMCANSSLAVHLIGPALFEFARTTPGIQVDLDAALSGAVASQADIELRITDTPPPDRAARLLTPIVWSFQASADYVARYGRPKTPEKMAQHRMVVPAAFNKSSTFKHRKTNQVITVTPGNAMTSNIQEVLFELVKRGETIGLLPNYLSSTAPKALGMREILKDWQLQNFPAHSLYAIHAPAKYQRAATRAVLDHLASACKKII